MQFKHGMGICLAIMLCGVGVFHLPAWGEEVAAPPDEPGVSFDQSYGGGFAGAPGRYDRNADGRIDLIIIDRNGDGTGDYWATDRNFDGIIDDYQYDRNFDGKIDQWEYDYDGDGIADKIFVDADNDGRSEMYSEWNPVTRSYTWFGKSGGSSNNYRSSIRPKRRLAKGRGADSF